MRVCVYTCVCDGSCCGPRYGTWLCWPREGRFLFSPYNKSGINWAGLCWHFSDSVDSRPRRGRQGNFRSFHSVEGMCISKGSFTAPSAPRALAPLCSHGHGRTDAGKSFREGQAGQDLTATPDRNSALVERSQAAELLEGSCPCAKCLHSQGLACPCFNKMPSVEKEPCLVRLGDCVAERCT